MFNFLMGYKTSSKYIVWLYPSIVLLSCSLHRPLGSALYGGRTCVPDSLVGGSNILEAEGNDIVVVGVTI